MRNQPSHQIVVEENHYRFIWGLVTLLSLLTGSILFDPLQNSGSVVERYGLIIFISLLFTTGIWGIYKTIQPIYTTKLIIENHILTVHIFYGEDTVKDYSIDLDNIETITYESRTPPGPNEALYDFATDYLVVYKKTNGDQFEPLINIEPEKMALKIKDIANIIRFLLHHKSTVNIPDEDRVVLGI